MAIHSGQGWEAYTKLPSFDFTLLVSAREVPVVWLEVQLAHLLTG